MANRNAPSGLRVAMHLAGGTPGRLSRYAIASGLAKNIYTGDVLIPVNTDKRVTRPTAGTERPIGVADGVYYVMPDGTPKFERYWPTGQTVQTGSIAECNVYDDPNTIFEIQSDGTFALADIGAFADYTVGTGNNFTGQSGDQLSESSVGSGTSMKILDYVRRPDNEIGLYTKVLVSFAIHYLRGAQTAI
jgi:hypothetical protein